MKGNIFKFILLLLLMVQILAVSSVFAACDTENGMSSRAEILSIIYGKWGNERISFEFADGRLGIAACTVKSCYMEDNGDIRTEIVLNGRSVSELYFPRDAEYNLMKLTNDKSESYFYHRLN